MRIAVISEISAADRNGEILMALGGLEHEVINAGMKKSSEGPELSYIHTGFMAAVLLNAKAVDYVIGGCGTGQGFLISVMQYPGVTCGHILNPLDAWLFTQINGGNCISLALNQGYGWAGDINLSFIFEKLFGAQSGLGYPAHRREAQKSSRLLIHDLNIITHQDMEAIIKRLPGEVIQPVVNYPGFLEVLELHGHTGTGILAALKKHRA
jgi:ribose 5-phosphate isomerase RpiB